MFSPELGGRIDEPLLGQRRRCANERHKTFLLYFPDYLNSFLLLLSHTDRLIL